MVTLENTSPQRSFSFGASSSGVPMIAHSSSISPVIKAGISAHLPCTESSWSFMPVSFQPWNSSTEWYVRVDA